MSLIDGNGNNGMVMPVSPMYGGGNMGMGYGGYGDGLFWIIVQNPNCCAQPTFGCACGSVA